MSLLQAVGEKETKLTLDDAAIRVSLYERIDFSMLLKTFSWRTNRFVSVTVC